MYFSLRFVRLSVEDNSIATADDTETYGACRSNNKGLQAFGIPILAVNICALVMACFQAYKARNISMEFSESKYLAIAVGSWFEVVLVGIPLLALVNSNPTASYFLKASMIFIVSMTLLLLIYIPKIHFHRQKQREKKEKQEKKQANARPSGVTAASDTASCMTEAGVRIVSMAPGAADNDEEDSSAARAREECEGLREELLAYRERLRQLENETSRKELDSDNRVSFSDNKVETALTIDDA